MAISGQTLPRKVGKDNHQMMEGIHEGEIDALYLYGEDTGIVALTSTMYKLHWKKLAS